MSFLIIYVTLILEIIKFKSVIKEESRIGIHLLTMLSIRELNIGTLNVRGCKTKEERKTVCKDAYQYHLQALAITETHMLGEKDIETIKIKDTEFILYSNGIIESENSFTGVGVIVDKDLNPDFERINDRICKAELNIDIDHKLVLIIAYAPTLIVSETDPQKRIDFYEKLYQIIEK